MVNFKDAIPKMREYRLCSLVLLTILVIGLSMSIVHVSSASSLLPTVNHAEGVSEPSERGANAPAQHVGFSEDNYSVSEAVDKATITVTLDIASSLTVTVDYATLDHEAVAGQDYLTTMGVLTFTPGMTQQTFMVSILNDALEESDETITLTLSNPTNATLRVLNAAVLTILDDDNYIYLPLALKLWPPIPEVPFLNPVDNSGGDVVNYTIRWDSAARAEAYMLEEATNADFTDATVVYQDIGTSYTVSNQLKGIYYYRVKATNSWGSSGWSNIQAVNVSPPNTPVLNAIDNDDGDGEYTVSWIAATLAQIYILQEDDNVAFSSPDTGYTGPALFLNVRGKEEGTYYYRVRASNTAGDSDWSTVQSVRVGPPDTPVLNAIDNDDGDGNYTVSWIAATLAQTYNLQENNKDLDLDSESGTSKLIRGRDIGTYVYRVRASNAFGSSDWSNTQTAVVTVPPPACPQLGSWDGENNQGYPLSFTVVNDPSCQLESFRIKFRCTCTDGWVTVQITFLSPRSVSDNHFEIHTSDEDIVGDFTSLTTAEGTWDSSFYSQLGYCSGSGTWTATYSP